ncbi:MAG: 5-oxoprolinase subunit B family protein [Mycobacterium sp.]
MEPGVTLRAYGDRALLIECACTAEVLAFTEAIREQSLPGVADIVPGARTVLVTLAGPDRLPATRARLAGLAVRPPEKAQPEAATELVIDVVYDGADLAEVAHLLSMHPDEVVAAHTGKPWRVGFGGFAPGFAYLTDGDPILAVPRRPEPRTRVPAGSVALAGEFSGVYPRESPGGWQLIGHTDAVLWDLDRPEPALLTPGRWVRFREMP